MKRRFFTAVFGGLFLVNAAAYTQTGPAPQGVTWSLTDLAAVVGILASVLTGIAFVAAMVWYILQGKSREQLKEQMEGWKDTAERLRAQLADARVERAENLALIEAVELENAVFRRANLRLQGLPDLKAP